MFDEKKQARDKMYTVEIRKRLNSFRLSSLEAERMRCMGLNIVEEMKKRSMDIELKSKYNPNYKD